MDTVEKEEIFQDARNMFIFAIYSVQVCLRRQQDATELAYTSASWLWN